MKQKRDNIPEPSRVKKSRLIEKSLWGLDIFKNAGTVMFYVSVGSEVITRKMIKRAIKEGKRVVVPFIEKTGKKIKAVRISSLEKDTVKGLFGIPAPKPSIRKDVQAKEIDIVVVPAVACDSSCHRIGYGGGYYDRWLKSIPLEARIGIAYDCQIVKSIKKSPNDVPLGLIVTEKRFIERKRRSVLSIRRKGRPG